MGQRALYDTQDQMAAWERFSGRLLGLASTPGSGFLTECSPKFLGLMTAAMMVSFHKYGAVAAGFPEKVSAIGMVSDPVLSELAHASHTVGNTFAHFGSMGQRLEWYFFGKRNPDAAEEGEPEYLIEPGNVEYLIDAANMLMIEFMHPAHPNAHYKATDRDGSPGRRAHNALYEGKANQFTNNELVDADEVVVF